MPVDTWFETKIYWNNLNLDNDSLKSVIGTKESENPEAWAHDCSSSFYLDRTLHEDERLSGFCSQIVKEMNDYCAQLGVDLGTHESVIKEMWFNSYTRGQGQESHIHAGSHISGIYFLEGDKSSAMTVFESPLSDKEMLPLPASQTFNTLRYPVIPGRLVLFRSWLRHAVTTQETEGRRTTISWNAFVLPKKKDL